VIKYKHLKRADREGGTYTAKYREIIWEPALIRKQVP
jgi:hypothetical protein